MKIIDEEDVKNEGKKLAKARWEYLKEALILRGISTEMEAEIGYHYTTGVPARVPPRSRVHE